jgi:hypothetical protein
MDDESNNEAGVADQDEADVVYNEGGQVGALYIGMQEAYNTMFIDQGHGVCMDKDHFALSLLNLMKHICAPHYVYG